MNVKRLLIVPLSSIFSASCSLFGVHNIEQPSYEVLLKEGKKEIRKYQSHIVAKTTVTGTFKDSQREGFRILARYIFGDNKSQQKIDMTAPVLQKPEKVSEKIEMTAPVLFSPHAGENKEEIKSWTMTFMMPSNYTLESLPQPNDKRIQLGRMKERFMAAYVFSGFWSESKNRDKAQKLSEWLSTLKEYEIISQPSFAGYNPPWTIPFLRRNEILIEIKPLE